MSSSFPEYKGLSYVQASDEAMAIIHQASKSQNWLNIVDRLVALRQIMNDHFDKA